MNLSKQEFLNCGTSAKYIQDKAALRNQIENDVSEWLRKNSVKELPGVGSVPRKEHKSKKVAVTAAQYRALLSWVNFDSHVAKRRKALADETGIPITRIRTLFANRKGRNAVVMSMLEYKLIIEAKAKIEGVQG